MREDLCYSGFNAVLLSYAQMDTERKTIENPENEQSRELEKAKKLLASEISFLKFENRILRERAEMLTKLLG
jgi:hypothetical protein